MNVPEWIRALAALGGAALVLTMISDAVATLITTRGRAAPWRPTRLWYTFTWWLTRLVVTRLDARSGDAVLNVYPALSLLGLLVLWLAGLCIGWSAIYWGLAAMVDGSGSWGTLVYYAGTSMLTPTFGAAPDAATRMLSLVEALTGLGTIALLISYLPALYGAYSAREARLLTLDDPRGNRLTPVRVIAVHASEGNLEPFYRFCTDWELWTSQVLESHVSYPMLALFRSQHVGQSWITALGVVVDAATLACAAIVGADSRESYFLYRRGRRAIIDIGERLGVRATPGATTWLSPERFDAAWEQLLELGVPLRGKEQSFERIVELRDPYADPLQQLIDFLLAPHGFWGHSAEERVAEEVAQATVEARTRVRRGMRSGATVT